MDSPVAYESAYPGSMIQQRHGSYVGRHDGPSLAAAMLELLTTRSFEVEDLKSALEAEQHISNSYKERITELEEQLRVALYGENAR